jgi:hypothetical protein
MKYTELDMKYYDCVFVFIILHAKYVLTSKFYAVEINKYQIITLRKSNLLCATVFYDLWPVWLCHIIIDVRLYMKCLIFLSDFNRTKLISSTSNLKFLGLKIDNTLTRKGHIEMIVPKVSAACFAVTAVKPFMSRDTLMMIYYSYFHSMMNYGLIFWRNSSYSNSISKLQKRIMRIIMGAGTRDSCTELFKILKVLPL